MIKPTDIGVLALEPWSRPFLNYQLNIAGLWHAWINSALYPVKSIYHETAGADPAVTLGVGVWIQIHSEVLGATTTYYWERDS